MKKLILSCILSLFFIPAFSQWAALPRLVVGSDTASQVTRIKSYYNKVYVCSNRGLFVSTDNGNTWSNLTYASSITQGKAIRTVHADSSAGRLYAGSDSAVFVSTDNGTSWNATPLTGLGKVNDIDQSANTIVVSYGVFPNGGVYYSTNGLMTANPATADNHAYFDFLADAGVIYLAGNGGVYKSTDNGLTWTISGTGFPVGASNLYSLTKSGTSLFAGNIGGNGLFKSADNGATWTEVDTNVFKGFCQVFDVVSANGTILTTMDGACNSSDPIKASTDDGATWAMYMTGLTPGFYPVLGRNTSGSCFFAFKNNDRTPYRICNPAGINEASTDIIAGIYPNPAKDQVTVSLAKASSFELRINNISGQLIHQQLVANTNKVTVDLADIANGIYFAQVRTKEGIQTIRFIKD
jgi:photosystem II stability/assembly factor-like uncharacterized protein